MRTLEKDRTWSADRIREVLTEYFDEFHPDKQLTDLSSVGVTLIRDIDRIERVGRFRSHHLADGLDEDWYETHKPNDFATDVAIVAQVVRAIELYVHIKHRTHEESFMTDETIRRYVGAFRRFVWSEEFHELLVRDLR